MKKGKKSKTVWKSIPIPEGLIEKIEEIIEQEKIYSSPAEYIREAIRMKIREDREIYNTQKKDKKEEEEE